MASFSAIALVERSKFGLNELLGVATCVLPNTRLQKRQHATAMRAYQQPRTDAFAQPERLVAFRAWRYCRHDEPNACSEGWR